MLHDERNHRTNRHRVKGTKSFVKELGQKISREWTHELKRNGKIPAEKSLFKLLMEALAGEVVAKLRESNDESVVALKDSLIVANRGPARKGLDKAERKLAKLAKRGHPDDAEEDEEDQKDTRYPNLKYRQPKYKNVESILKFVESKNDKGGGVRLVIMNFND